MSGTPTSGVDYAVRILGAQPTERQRAEVSQAMLRHGIAPDHPMLGVICEMILYRDQMDKYVVRMEAASKIANDARAVINDREKKIETHLANLSARMAEMEQAARERLEQPLRDFEKEMKEKRDKQEKELQEWISIRQRKILENDLETSRRLNEAAWRTALSFRWGAILAAGGFGLGIALGIFLMYGGPTSLGCVADKVVMGTDNKTRFVQCQ